MLKNFTDYLAAYLSSKGYEKAQISSPKTEFNVWRIESVQTGNILGSGIGENPAIQAVVTLRFLLVSEPYSSWDKLFIDIRELISGGSKYILGVDNVVSSFVPEMSVDLLIVDFNMRVLFSEEVSNA